MNLLARLSVLFLFLPVVAAIAQDPAQPAIPVQPQVDQTSRFLFYSVLEGLYEDGASNEDVAQILMKKDKNSCYFHFIYSCPICSATIWALEAYQNRPDRFYSLKFGSTFGPGLNEPIRKKLYSDKPQDRLEAINGLVRHWVERRMKAMNLTDAERAALQQALEKKRKEGMEALERFRKLEHGASFSVAEAAPAYEGRDECAACNGAVGKPMGGMVSKPGK